MRGSWRLLAIILFLAGLVTVRALASSAPNCWPQTHPENTVAFARIMALRDDEQVFAYARVSPSGKYLAYSSEIPPGQGAKATQIETVIELATKRIVFSEPGIDGYFSNDEKRLIFLSQANGNFSVAIWHSDGRVARNVAPVSLGDYFSWSVRNGRDTILTIQSNFYQLDGDTAVLPAEKVTSCAGIGVGSRPLISKDGQRVTTFVDSNVVVRGLTTCNDIVDTGLQGAKADFSFDGRYVAFHVEKKDRTGAEIVIVDTLERTFRTLSGLNGSALFPSWTRDGRICFRYDGSEYRGFMFASNVLSLPARPLPERPPSAARQVRWTDLFVAPPPKHRTNVVMIWSDWSSHSPRALSDLQRVSDELETRGQDVGTFAVAAPGMRKRDADSILRSHDIHLPELQLKLGRVGLTGALNQIPTELIFRDGILLEQRLGPLSYEDLRQWLKAIDQKP